MLLLFGTTIVNDGTRIGPTVRVLTYDVFLSGEAAVILQPPRIHNNSIKVSQLCPKMVFVY
jgi:hypothetical protein